MSTTNGITDLLGRAVEAIEAQRWLDAVGYKLEHAVALTFGLLGSRGRAVQDIMHGTWLGHPVHPSLTDIPIGAWTVAFVLDAADVMSSRREGRRAAGRLAVGVGILGGAGAAITGLTDWQHTHDGARRAGLAHAAVNSAALGLNALSWRDRHKGRYARARVTSGLGYVLVLAGGYLGGTLVFGHGIGVDHASEADGPRAFVAVLPEADLLDGTPQQVECDGVPVVLIRHDGLITALGQRCSHLGAPMSEGWLYRGELVCPWHGSRFDSRTGRAVTGPATAPLPCYQTRVLDGQIELRRLPAGSSAPPATTNTYKGSS